MQAIQSIFCSKKGNIAREINGCFLNKTSHIMVFMHKNKRFMHKCIHMHKKKTRELYCIISDVTRREREQKTPDWLKKWGISTCFSDYIFDRPGFPCTLSVAMLKSKKEWKGIVKQR